MGGHDHAFLMLAISAAATYACRALGVFLAGRMDAASLFFQWVACVTYAMVAALTVRLLVFPQGLLGSMPLSLRLVIGGLGMALVWLRPQGSLLLPLGLGMLATLCFGVWGPIST